MKRVIVTGANGFIGSNLCLRLAELGRFDVVPIDVDSSATDLRSALRGAGAVVHLAGVNRPIDQDDFMTGNHGSLAELISEIQAGGQPVPVILTSSIQAEIDNPYGQSKKAAEDALLRFSRETDNPAWVFRLPNVFGKWARPNYNSAVATFCHNIARGMEITINNSEAPLDLIYIDDLVDRIVELLDDLSPPSGPREAFPVYSTTVGDVAAQIRQFAESRETLLTDRVGAGFTRALYSTYLSYLRPDDFSYAVPRHADARGVFVEMLKTPDCGQFSYFTAGPGVTRGEHYHHTKTEKFLVLAGVARFGFRHMTSNQRHEITTKGGDGLVVETIPGWTHDITNAGDTEMIVMLWANEVFDRQRPDTIAEKVDA